MLLSCAPDLTDCGLLRVVTLQCLGQNTCQSHHPSQRDAGRRHAMCGGAEGGEQGEAGDCGSTPVQLRLSLLNHRLPRSQAHLEVRQGTAEFPHQVTAPRCHRRLRSLTLRQRWTRLGCLIIGCLPVEGKVFDAAPALDTARAMADPQPTLVERLMRHGLLPREFLPQIGINSHDFLLTSAGLVSDVGQQ
jgi:hypothetical protein